MLWRQNLYARTIREQFAYKISAGIQMQFELQAMRIIFQYFLRAVQGHCFYVISCAGIKEQYYLFHLLFRRIDNAKCIAKVAFCIKLTVGCKALSQAAHIVHSIQPKSANKPFSAIASYHIPALFIFFEQIRL